MPRHVAEAKPGKTEEIDVVILSAGIGYTTRSYGPKALFKLHDKTLLEHQISTLRGVFHCNIIVVVGFQYEKIIRRTQQDVRFVYNPLYDEYNILHSILVGLLNCTKSKVLVVYGDLVFDARAVNQLTPDNTSKILVDKQGQIGNNKVGVAQQDKIATNLSFGLRDKWAQIIYLTGKELILMRDIVQGQNNKVWLGHEAINSVIENKGKFTIIQPEMFIREITSVGDIKDANTLSCVHMCPAFHS